MLNITFTVVLMWQIFPLFTLQGVIKHFCRSRRNFSNVYLLKWQLFSRFFYCVSVFVDYCCHVSALHFSNITCQTNSVGGATTPFPWNFCWWSLASCKWRSFLWVFQPWLLSLFIKTRLFFCSYEQEIICCAPQAFSQETTTATRY